MRRVCVYDSCARSKYADHNLLYKCTDSRYSAPESALFRRSEKSTHLHHVDHSIGILHVVLGLADFHANSAGEALAALQHVEPAERTTFSTGQQQRHNLGPTINITRTHCGAGCFHKKSWESLASARTQGTGSSMVLPSIAFNRNSNPLAFWFLVSWRPVVARVHLSPPCSCSCLCTVYLSRTIIKIVQHSRSSPNDTGFCSLALSSLHDGRRQRTVVCLDGIQPPKLQSTRTLISPIRITSWYPVGITSSAFGVRASRCQNDTLIESRTCQDPLETEHSTHSTE